MVSLSVSIELLVMLESLTLLTRETGEIAVAMGGQGERIPAGKSVKEGIKRAPAAFFPNFVEMEVLYRVSPLKFVSGI